MFNVSAKVEYGCLAMLELAKQHDTGRPLQLRKIIETHDVPAQFLVQILLQLKSAGLVASTRGAAGGYRLTRPPSQINLSHIVKAINGSALQHKSILSTANSTAGTLRDTFSHIAESGHKQLQATTLGDLAERVRETAEPMYYI